MERHLTTPPNYVREQTGEGAEGISVGPAPG